MAMLSIERPDNQIRRGPLLLFVGFGIAGLAGLTGFGAPTALHFIGFGALLGCVDFYKSERGIWMLALLFGTVLLTVALICEFGMLRDAFRGAPRPDWTVVLDLAIALQLQWLIVPSLLSVVVHNRRFTVK